MESHELTIVGSIERVASDLFRVTGLLRLLEDLPEACRAEVADAGPHALRRSPGAGYGPDRRGLANLIVGATLPLSSVLVGGGLWPLLRRHAPVGDGLPACYVMVR
jgi:hypothetical protein